MSLRGHQFDMTDKVLAYLRLPTRHAFFQARDEDLHCKNVSDLTQQDSRKKRTAKRLCVTSVTGLFHACFVVILT